MANARALDKRRKSIKNIRKITRTMELIATARFKKAMDRATAASAYTKRITKLVSDLAATGLEVSHPLMEAREETKRARIARAHVESRFLWRIQRKRHSFGSKEHQPTEADFGTGWFFARGVGKTRHHSFRVGPSGDRVQIHSF